MAWFRLIRWSNLVIIFLTQFVVWYCVLRPFPLHGLQTGPLFLDTVNFLCLSFSTVLIAAAGYIINDYFDIRIDAINRPEKVLLREDFSRKMAIILHAVFNFAALLLVARLAWKAGHWEWLFLQLFCIGMLWLYSTYFKRRFITGNVVVSLMTVLTIVVVVAYEPWMYRFLHAPAFLHSALHFKYINPLYTASLFCYFAFFMNWMREIVKDMEDLKGDSDEHCETMPIRWGLRKSSRFVQVLGALVLVPVMICVILTMKNGLWMVAATMLILVGAPLLFWLINLTRSATTTHYSKASSQIKWIMVAGIFCLFALYINIKYLAHLSL